MNYTQQQCIKPNTFGPQYIFDLNAICQSLGRIFSSVQILSLAKDAFAKGYLLGDKIVFNNQACHQIVHQNMRFILSQDMTTIILIQWNKQIHVQQHTQNQFIAQPQQQQTSSCDEIALDLEDVVDEIVADLFENETAYLASESMSKCMPPMPSPQQLTNDWSLSSDDTVCSQLNLAPPQPMQPQVSQPKREYHTIYLKPIMERLQMISPLPLAQRIDADYVVEIVDCAIKYGVKRQISKRTFEFKWRQYVVIMSKSLKTILDVSLAAPNCASELITVHPDVVSIISKKCQRLNYFNIRKVAEMAKCNGLFITKKNEYRQQFIYNFCGCRIVFASNHCTIVEMQCNDYSLMMKSLF